MGVGRVPSLLGGSTYLPGAADFGRRQMFLMRAGRKKLREDAAEAAHHAAELYRRSGFSDIAQTIEHAVTRAQAHERAEAAEPAFSSLLSSAGARRGRGRPRSSTDNDHELAAQHISACLNHRQTLRQAIARVAQQAPWASRKTSTHMLRRYWNAAARKRELTPDQLVIECGGQPWRGRRKKNPKVRMIFRKQ
jgi:hypothetical protein